MRSPTLGVRHVEVSLTDRILHDVDPGRTNGSDHVADIGSHGDQVVGLSQDDSLEESPEGFAKEVQSLVIVPDFLEDQTVNGCHRRARGHPEEIWVVSVIVDVDDVRPQFF
jgi:hypothetical protein